VYLHHGWNQKAVEAVRKAVDLNSNYAPAVGNLGINYMDQGKLDEALPWLKKFVALDPASAFPYLSMGDLYFTLDDIPKAEQYLNKSLELQPDFVYPHEVFVLMYLAQGKYELAREHAEKALSIDPTDNEALAYSGFVELFSGNYEKARDFYQKSLGSTIIPEYRIRLGYALWKLGQKDQARKLFQEALQSDQDRVARGDEDGWPRYDIAAVNAIQGNKTEAYRWLQKAVDAGAIYYRLMLRDPLFENLRGDTQFQQMMARVKVRVDEMRRRAEQDKGSIP
jgi:tetratricopeptide (TPR) repeat protein